MLADPRHSAVVLINPSRAISGGGHGEGRARRRTKLALLAACSRLLELPLIALGECERELLPDMLADTVIHIDVNPPSIWQEPRFAERLAAADLGVIFVGGAWLAEDVLVASLQGARLGYDVRVLMDATVPRESADRSVTLARLLHHGIVATTVRQTLSEWSVSVQDHGKAEKIRSMLFR